MRPIAGTMGLVRDERECAFVEELAWLEHRSHLESAANQMVLSYVLEKPGKSIVLTWVVLLLIKIMVLSCLLDNLWWFCT